MYNNVLYKIKERKCNLPCKSFLPVNKHELSFPVCFPTFCLNFVGLLFIATRICCSSFLSICLGDSTLSANTVIFRVSSWTSEKMGIKKEKADVIGTDHYNNDTHIAITNDKDKRYVKKMLEANSQLQPGIKL